MAGVGLGEGGLGWSVDSAGPTVTAAWPTWVPECPGLQRPDDSEDPPVT